MYCFMMHLYSVFTLYLRSYALLQPARIFITTTLFSLGLELEWITWWLDQTPLTKLVSVDVSTPRGNFLSTQDNCCRNLKVSIMAPLACFACKPGLHLALHALRNWSSMHQCTACCKKTSWSEVPTSKNSYNSSLFYWPYMMKFRNDGWK